jgi:hypothetical protein
MAVSRLDRRASKLEDSMEGLRKQKQAEERAGWRRKNSRRLRWEMFLRNHGPESIEWSEKEIQSYDPEERAECEAGIACREMLEKVLAKYRGCAADFEAMGTTEKAFAHLLNEFELFIGNYALFDRDLDYWQDKLGLAEIRPPFVDLIRAIDEHTGSSYWREICYLQNGQDALMEQIFENYEEGRARYLQNKLNR